MIAILNILNLLQMKMVAKSKASGYRMELGRTGGGTVPDEFKSSASDDRILSLIGKVCVEGIEQGRDINELVLQRMSGKKPSM